LPRSSPPFFSPLCSVSDSQLFGTVARYLAAVEDLAATLSRRMVDGREEIAGALRELVAAVVVHPAGRDEPRIEVTGPLAQLTGAPELFPQQDIAAPRTLVAGTRYSRQERANGGLYAFPA
jgi:hypothetical protein